MADNQAQSYKNVGSTSDHQQMEKGKGKTGDHKFEPKYKFLDIVDDIEDEYRLATVKEVSEDARQVTKVLDDSFFAYEKEGNSKSLNTSSHEGYKPDGYVSSQILEIFRVSQGKVEVLLQGTAAEEPSQITFTRRTNDTMMHLHSTDWPIQKNKEVVDISMLKLGQPEQDVRIKEEVYHVKLGLMIEDLISTEGDPLVDIDAEIPHGYELISFEDFIMFASSENKCLQKKIDITYGPTTGASTWVIVQRSSALRLGNEQDSRGIPFYYDDTLKRKQVRLKDGFIDTSTRLMWDQFCSERSLFGKLVVRKLTNAKGNENEVVQGLERKRELVALLFACEFYEEDEVEQFLRLPHFIDVILKNSVNAPHQGNAFHLCASKGYTDIMRKLLEKLKYKQKALTATTGSPEKETPLMLAVLGGHGDVVQMLCEEEEKSWNPYTSDEEKEQQELDEEQEEESKKESAVEKRPGVDLQNHQAAQGKGRKEPVAARSINLQTNEGKSTALMMAAEYHMMSPSVWKPILKCAGLDLSLTNKRQNTVLHTMMCYSGPLKMKLFRPVMLKHILEKCGCKVSYKAYCTDATSLTWKVAKEVAKFYRRNKLVSRSPTEALIDANDDMNQTPLHRALWFANIRKAATLYNPAASVIDGAAAVSNAGTSPSSAISGSNASNPYGTYPSSAASGSNAPNPDAHFASHGLTQGYASFPLDAALSASDAAFAPANYHVLASAGTYAPESAHAFSPIDTSYAGATGLIAAAPFSELASDVPNAPSMFSFGPALPNAPWRFPGDNISSEAPSTTVATDFSKTQDFNTIMGRIQAAQKKYEEVAAAPQSIREEIPIQLSRLLISAGADIEAKDFRGQNALHIACQLPDDAGTVQLLLCCFFGEYIDDEGCLEGFQTEIERRQFVKAQQAWKNYISTRDFFGHTPLHLAAQSGNRNVIRLLLDEDFNMSVNELIEMRDYDDKTILHFVATPPSSDFEVEERVKIEIAEFILDVLPHDLRPLLLWSTGEHLDVADRYLKKYPLLSDYLKAQRENAKENILGLALEYERYDMVVELINRGAVITEKMRENAMIEYLLNTEMEYHRKQEDEMQPMYFDDDEIRFGAMFGRLKRAFYFARMKNVERAIERRKLQRRSDEPELKNIEELDKIQESHQGRTTDQPTNEDLLERGDIKYAISALLLNQHMGSPITLGILGGTGMGKSSMMLQVEHSLLSRAAMETLSPALQSDKKSVSKNNYFTGAKREPSRLKKHAQKLLVELKGVFEELEEKERYHHPQGKKTIDLNKLSKQRKSLLRMLIDKAKYRVKSYMVSQFEAKGVVIETMEQKIQKYIMQYNEMHTWIAKRIALANVGDNVPGIVTVQYNAWQYESKDEAWAGLAVAILKEMESSMPKADLLRASFMYSYKKNPTSATMKLAIPIVIYLIAGCIVASALFFLFSLPKVPTFLQPYKYASIPLSILAALWQAMVKISSYVQPISESLIEKTRGLQNDHLAKVGYQHQVIQDVTYLKTCISTTMSFSILWWSLATILNIASGSPYLTTRSEASDRLKYLPKGKNFRIIVFIDNLDRQKEELFTPLNIILKACDINAVVAIDKGSTQGVTIMESTSNHKGSTQGVPTMESTTSQDEGNENENKRTTLLQQLIQIPIVLPEPDVYELANAFLDEHLKNFESKKDKFNYNVQKKTKRFSLTPGDSMRSLRHPILASSRNQASNKSTSRNIAPTFSSAETTKEGSSHQGTASKTQYTTTQFEEIQINVLSQISTSEVNTQEEASAQNDGPKDKESFEENKNIQKARVEKDSKVKRKDKATKWEGKREKKRKDEKEERGREKKGKEKRGTQSDHEDKDNKNRDSKTQEDEKDEDEKDYKEDYVMMEGKDEIVDKEKVWQAMNINVLDTNYSRGEIEVFKYLAKHTYGYYRSPRAWKSLLNYHRLVRSVITYTYSEVGLKAWKRQLVIWVFVCWQWKDEMNEIFENWEELTALSLKSLSKEELPLEERRILTQMHIRQHDKSLDVHTLRKKEYARLWEQHINVSYGSLSKIVKKHMDTSKLKKTTWTNLQSALSVGDIDINMQAMQAFQKYRFDCDSRPLKLILNN